MTLEETGQILAYLESLFPQTFRGQTDKQRQMTLQVWFQELKLHKFTDVQAAVRTAIREKKPTGFAPGFDEIVAQLPLPGQLALPWIDEYDAKVLAWLESERRKANA